MVQDGLTWETAFTKIQPAIDLAARRGGEVWVAAGVYDEEREFIVPSLSDADFNLGSISLHDRVSLYGGFNGTETLLTERDPTANETILDGSEARDGGPALHVVVLGDKTVLNGFTIRGGRSSEFEQSFTQYQVSQGGGIYAADVSAAIAHCIFEDNLAVDVPGGPAPDGDSVFAERSRLSFHECLFRNHTGDFTARFDASHVTLSEVEFLNNFGGINAPDTEVHIRDSVFRNTMFSAVSIQARDTAPHSVQRTRFENNFRALEVEGSAWV
ncbi:MAG: right-handed parallel beta-helix repeat-containing protein, partial [Candidatus Hydrogenedentales bacterium]